MYRVIVPFKDLQDNGYVYRSGDIYPREGVKSTQKRIDELSTPSNRRGVPLIKGLSGGSERPPLAIEGMDPVVGTPTKQTAKKKPRKSHDDRTDS